MTPSGKFSSASNDTAYGDINAAEVEDFRQTMSSLAPDLNRHGLSSRQVLEGRIETFGLDPLGESSEIKEPLTQKYSSERAQKDILDLIYQEREVASKEFDNARRILATGLELLAAAIDEFNTDAIHISDDYMQRFYTLLPELFCCRSIGEGYAAVINAIWNAIDNRNGVPVELKQLHAIRRALNRIRTEPFSDINIAVKIVMFLEDSGLDVEPKALENHLSDVLGLDTPQDITIQKWSTQ